MRDYVELDIIAGSDLGGRDRYELRTLIIRNLGPHPTRSAWRRCTWSLPKIRSPLGILVCFGLWMLISGAAVGQDLSDGVSSATAW